MRVLKCKKCGAEVVRIQLGNGRVAICEAKERHYWLNNPTTTIITPNGEEIFASLQGDLQDAYGIGRTIHSCNRAQLRVPMRPMAPYERKYAYMQPNDLISRTGSLGYLHGDFGRSGTEFHETWFSFDGHPQSPPLRMELTMTLDQLRVAEPKLLGSLADMRRCVRRLPESRFKGNYCTEYAFRFDAENHTFLLRCIPVENDYQFYVFAYISNLLNAHMQNAEQGIVLYGPDHDPKFRIKDGTVIESGPRGKRKTHTCRFVDECSIIIDKAVYPLKDFVIKADDCGTRYILQNHNTGATYFVKSKSLTAV